MYDSMEIIASIKCGVYYLSGIQKSVWQLKPHCEDSSKNTGSDE